MKENLKETTFSNEWLDFLKQRGRYLKDTVYAPNRCVGHYEVFRQHSKATVNNEDSNGINENGLTQMRFNGDGYCVNLKCGEIFEGVYLDFGSYDGDFSNLSHTQIKPTLHFGLMQKGGYKALLDKKHFALSQGDIYIVAPDTHSIKSENEVRCECVQISIDIQLASKELAKMFKNFCLKGFYEAMQHNALIFKSNVCQKMLFNALCYTSDMDLLRLRVLESILAMQKCSQRQLKQCKQCKMYIDDVVKYIATHLLEDTSLNDLSEIFNVSVSKLTQDFKNAQGISIYQFIKHLRLERACELLQKGEENITQIAVGLGYTNISAFAKNFKEVYLLSPSEYARKYYKNNA